MGDSHAYGVVALVPCMSRRMYIMTICVILFLACLVQVLLWLRDSGVYDVIMGNKAPPMPGCSGSHCYEVFSCYGLRETSLNCREPWFSFFGLGFFLSGLIGAHLGVRWMLSRLTTWLLICFAVHLLVLVSDVIYVEACDAYPVNLVAMTLTSRFPPMPIRLGTQDQLRAMSTYPIAQTNELLRGFDAMVWYACIMSLWTLFLGYSAYESWNLTDLVERGPLGLGVHYGLDQWDEVLNYDALQRKYIKATVYANLRGSEAEHLPLRGQRAPKGLALGTAPLAEADRIRDEYGATQRRRDVEEPPVLEEDWASSREPGWLPGIKNYADLPGDPEEMSWTEGTTTPLDAPSEGSMTSGAPPPRVWT